MDYRNITTERDLIIRDAMKDYACKVLGRATKTAHDYAHSMERYLPRFLEREMNYRIRSIYDITNLTTLQGIYDSIQENPEWKKYNQRSHASTLTSGLMCYMNFLQSVYYPFKVEEKDKNLLLMNNTIGEDWTDESSLVDGWEIHVEGNVHAACSVRYERNQQARKACLDHYGYRCSVCGFDFEREYGELGHNYIEVHHLVPISSIGKEYQVNPIQDLRPLCSNCHAMIHRASKTLTIEELIRIRIEAANKFIERDESCTR